MARGRMYSAMQPWGGQGFEDPWTARNAQSRAAMQQMQLQSLLQSRLQDQQTAAAERMQEAVLNLQRERMARDYGFRGEELGLRREQLAADRDWRSGANDRQLALQKGLMELQPAWTREDPVSRARRKAESLAEAEDAIAARRRQSLIEMYRQQGLLGAGTPTHLYASPTTGQSPVTDELPISGGAAVPQQQAVPAVGGKEAAVAAPAVAAPAVGSKEAVVAALQNAKTIPEMMKAIAIARLQQKPVRYVDAKGNLRVLDAGLDKDGLAMMLEASVAAKRKQQEERQASYNALVGEIDKAQQRGDYERVRALRAELPKYVDPKLPASVAQARGSYGTPTILPDVAPRDAKGNVIGSGLSQEAIMKDLAESYENILGSRSALGTMFNTAFSPIDVFYSKKDPTAVDAKDAVQQAAPKIEDFFRKALAQNVDIDQVRSALNRLKQDVDARARDEVTDTAKYAARVFSGELESLVDSLYRKYRKMQKGSSYSGGGGTGPGMVMP